MQNGQDFVCVAANGGIPVCSPQTDDARNVYLRLQKTLQEVGAQIPVLDGIVAPTTALAAQQALTALAPRMPVPIELLFLVRPGASSTDSIQLVAQNAEAIINYIGAAKDLPEPKPPAPEVKPFPTKPLIKIGAGALAVGGVLGTIYWMGKRASGTVDGRRFLPPPQGDDDEEYDDED